METLPDRHRRHGWGLLAAEAAQKRCREVESLQTFEKVVRGKMTKDELLRDTETVSTLLDVAARGEPLIVRPKG